MYASKILVAFNDSSVNKLLIHKAIVNIRPVYVWNKETSFLIFNL